jgi:MoaA/NifB/PqqE/SkfB family radical SAM enzyme
MEMTQPEPLKCFFLEHGYNNLNSSACCELTNSFPSAVNFASLHNNKSFVEIKQSMDAGIWHSACERCRMTEASPNTQAQSKRQGSLKKYTFSNYNKNAGLIDLQLAPGYLCNLQCRTCNPYLSSSWVKEDIELPGALSRTPRDSFSIPIKVNRQSMLDYNTSWTGVKYVNFVGGEPLYNPEFYTALAKLLADTDGDCELALTTNGTVLLDLDKYQLLSNFKRVYLTVSIDSIGASAEFIRTGVTWSKVVKNIEFYKSSQMFSNAINFHLTNSVLNMFETHPALEWLESMEIPNCGLTTHISDPQYLTYNILTDLEKQVLVKRLTGTKADYIASVLPSYQHSPADRSNFFQFMEHTKNYHGQDWKDYLPELYSLMN